MSILRIALLRLCERHHTISRRETFVRPTLTMGRERAACSRDGRRRIPRVARRRNADSAPHALGVQQGLAVRKLGLGIIGPAAQGPEGERDSGPGGRGSKNGDNSGSRGSRPSREWQNIVSHREISASAAPNLSITSRRWLFQGRSSFAAIGFALSEPLGRRAGSGEIC